MCEEINLYKYFIKKKMSSDVHCELVKNIVKRTGYLDRIISEGFKIREIK